MEDVREITLVAPSRVHKLEDLVEELDAVSTIPVYEDETEELNRLRLDAVTLLMRIESGAAALRGEIARDHYVQ